MKNLKTTLSIIFVVLPLLAFASGSEILPLFLLPVGVTIVLVVVLLFIDIPCLAKVAIFSAYIMASFVNYHFFETFTYGYYLENEFMVNLRCLLPQIIVTILAYYLVRNKFKKSTRQSFDDFIPEKSAEEIINELKESRNFNRNTEEF